MADIKISELGAASAVNNTDLFPMTSAGVTVKATAQQIKNYMGVGNLSDLDTTDKTSAVAAVNEVNAKVTKTEVLTSNIESSIAPIQSTLTASTNYKVGEQFYYQGLLYTVTQGIASGSSITIGSNCTLSSTLQSQLRYNFTNKIYIEISDVLNIKDCLYMLTYRLNQGMQVNDTEVGTLLWTDHDYILFHACKIADGIISLGAITYEAFYTARYNDGQSFTLYRYAGTLQ